MIIGGGAVLQPVLYAMAIEAALDQPVYCGRLYYCTSAGSFHAHEIPLNERTREAGLEVLQVVDRAIEHGFLAPAPTEEACGRCDFRPVCGRACFSRVLRKPQDRLADLAGAEEPAMTPPPRTTPTKRRGGSSATHSTRRSSSRPRPAPARRRSW